MSKKVLKPEYKASKPWARAVIANGFVFLSGVAGVDPETEKVVPGIRNQMELALRRIKATLEAAGTSLENVVTATVYITDVEYWAELRKSFYGYFPSPIASVLVEVGEMPRKEALIEIVVTAVLSS